MEIFNIHIFEFLLIAGLGLIIFGPERLPEAGRFLGQQVAKFLAWQQNSPELRMLTEVRSEFEREIAELRDELVRTRQQLDIGRDMTAIKDELRPMLDLKNGINLNPVEPTIAPPQNGASPAQVAAEGTPTEQLAADAVEAVADRASKPVADVLDDLADAAGKPAVNAADALDDLADVAAEAAPEPPLTVRPAAQTVTAAAQPNRLAMAQPSTVLGTPLPSAGDQPTDELIAAHAEQLAARRTATAEAAPAVARNEPEALVSSDQERLLERVQSLAAELQALTTELRERGLLSTDWQAPERAHEETLPR